MFRFIKNSLIFLLISFLHLFLEAGNKEHSSYPNFDNHPYLSKKKKEKIEPFLLPMRHPLKKKLDAIFNLPGTIQNESFFAKAGFKTVSVQPTSYIRIAKHPLLPNHLFKLFLDSEKRKKENTSGWVWLVKRCQGARNIKELIKRKKLRHFVVPEKWLYPVPWVSRKQGEGGSRQPVVLITEDMKLVSHHENVNAWKNKITKEHLRELYCILSHGYASCYVTQNIPYTKKGKFACIDTEHPKRNLRSKYGQVKTYLSDEMKKYWEILIRSKGKG